MREFINSILNAFLGQIDEMVIIFILILILIVLQKYFYNMLFFIANSNKLFSFVFNFFIRAGVIIHEFAHMFFAFLFGNKIQEVKLFEKNGGYVKYSYKNYIAALPDGFNHISYWFMLIINQFGIFFTALGPMIVGIILAYFLFGTNDLSLHNIYSLLENKGIYLEIYTLLVPSFIISWTDFSHFIISRQYGVIATLVGSFLNFLIFILFLFVLSYFFNYFLIFTANFLASFVIIFLISSLLYIKKLLD